MGKNREHLVQFVRFRGKKDNLFQCCERVSPLPQPQELSDAEKIYFVTGAALKLDTAHRLMRLGYEVVTMPENGSHFCPALQNMRGGAMLSSTRYSYLSDSPQSC